MKYKFIKKAERIKDSKAEMMVFCVNPESERLSCMYEYNVGWDKVWEDPSNKIIKDQRKTIYYLFKEVK